jgi:hypothetical protein
MKATDATEARERYREVEKDSAVTKLEMLR